MRQEQALINRLLNRRMTSKCACKDWGEAAATCAHHQNNNKEVHYVSLEDAYIRHVSERWLDFLLGEDREKRLTYFHILGINVLNLDYKLFGDDGSKRAGIIYNRFFRTAIKYPLKTFFDSHDKVIVDNVFHDSDEELRRDEYFPWHTPFRVNKDEDAKVRFQTDGIQFLDSKHSESNDPRSHLIQYIDLILGLTYNCLHHEGKSPDRTAITKKSHPLVSRLVKAPKNKNSSYRYYKRQSISFFPKTGIAGADFSAENAFYTERDLLIERHEQGTLSLDFGE